MKSHTLGAAVAAVVLTATAAASDVNRIVLQINDHIATLHDYQMRYGERLRAIQAAQLPEAERATLLAELGESVFREMFDEMLLLSRAKQEGMEITEAMVDDAVQGMRDANGLQDQAQFEAALASSGMTRAMLRDQARRSLLLQQVTARELQARIDLDDEDLRRYYQSHLEEFAQPRRLQLRSIVVLDSSELDADARRQLASTVATRFAAADATLDEWLAERAAAGETTGLIDLGWVVQGDLDPGIESVVWELEAGSVSEPLDGRGGLHVVEVVAIEEASVRPFSEVRNEVERLELLRLQQEAVTTMLSDLEQSSYIRIDPPPEAAGFSSTRALLEQPLGEVAPPAETPVESAVDGAPDTAADGP